MLAFADEMMHAKEGRISCGYAVVWLNCRLELKIYFIFLCASCLSPFS